MGTSRKDIAGLRGSSAGIGGLIVSPFGRRRGPGRLASVVAWMCLLGWSAAGLAEQQPLGPVADGGGTALERIPGFDASRLRAMLTTLPGAEVSNDFSADELARLLDRLGRLTPGTLEACLSESATAGQLAPAVEMRTGDVVRVGGTVVGIGRSAVTPSLAEMLTVPAVWACQVRSDEGRLATLYVPPVPRAEFRAGDRLEATGVSIGTVTAPDGGEVTHMVAARPEWIPARMPDIGWAMLSSAGLNLAGLMEAADRDRQRLGAEDGDTFYGMLAAARRVTDAGADLPQPTIVQPLDLLGDPHAFTGHWLRIPVEIIRVTRVSLQEQPRRAERIGGDHYFQIDAIGDLGNVELQIPAADEGEEPVRFRNRYPVTVVATELPPGLREAMDRAGGPGAYVARVSLPTEVDGFFFRLWSYESDLMSRRGGDQFGPLIVAGRLRVLSPPGEDPAGVNRIGWAAAAVVLGALAATVVAAWVTQRRDERIRRQRRLGESDRLKLPPEST